MWVFNGASANFPAGVFSRIEKAEQWIAKDRLTGTLTRYPLDEGAYDRSIANALFTPSKPQHSTAEFIGEFSGGQTHFHYEDGNRQTRRCLCSKWRYLLTPSAENLREGCISANDSQTVNNSANAVQISTKSSTESLVRPAEPVTGSRGCRPLRRIPPSRVPSDGRSPVYAAPGPAAHQRSLRTRSEKRHFRSALG